MKPLTTKTEVKRLLGFFSYLREHAKDFANVAQPLTDLTSKKYSGTIHWKESQQQSVEELKRLLCKATVEPLYIVDFARPFNSFVDASLHTVSTVLTQTDDDGTELPVVFSSTKLSQAQMALSTFKQEAYAVLVALKKYRSWIFGTKVTVYSDHNARQYLIEAAPKSAKLMRWSLGLQEFSLTFKYKCGKTNAAADCLSRL